MLRGSLHSPAVAAAGLSQHRLFIHNHFTRTFATRRTDHSEEDLEAARRWLSDFDGKKIPRSDGELTYSRSQGAGGQHVNTTDSKATLLYPLQALRRVVPGLLLGPLRRSRHYVAGADAIRISASTQRRQQRNAEECWQRLAKVVRELAREEIPPATSQAQVERVARLQKQEDAMRMKMKKLQSSKKDSRRKGTKGDDY